MNPPSKKSENSSDQPTTNPVPTKRDNDGTDDELEDSHKRIKMKNYTSANSGISHENLFSYFCALCGTHCILIDISLDRLNVRNTDNAIIVPFNGVFHKHYLKRGGIKYIIREKGIEQQWRWICECGVLIGYQCISYEEMEELEKNKKKDSSKIIALNKPNLYILSDSLVIDTKQSKLIQELENFNEFRQ